MKKTKKTPKKQLEEQHYNLTMTIAVQAVRINEMQKFLSQKCDELLNVEAQMERIEAEESNGGLN